MKSSSMLRAIPTGFFSWGFSILEGDSEMAELEMAWIGERGNFSYEGQRYELYRQGWLTGQLVLDAGGKIVAEAKKVTPFSRTFDVVIGNRPVQLAAISPFTRAFGVYSGGNQIGSIYPDHCFTRKATLELPPDMALPARVFLFWLVALMWRRAAKSSD
jgi:hypothetical protein